MLLLTTKTTVNECKPRKNKCHPPSYPLLHQINLFQRSFHIDKEFNRISHIRDILSHIGATSNVNDRLGIQDIVGEIGQQVFVRCQEKSGQNVHLIHYQLKFIKYEKNQINRIDMILQIKANKFFAYLSTSTPSIMQLSPTSNGCFTNMNIMPSNADVQELPNRKPNTRN